MRSLAVFFVLACSSHYSTAENLQHKGDTASSNVNDIADESLNGCYQDLCKSNKDDFFSRENRIANLKKDLQKLLGKKLRESVQESLQSEIDTIDMLIDKIEHNKFDTLLSSDPTARGKETFALIKEYMVDISTNMNLKLDLSEGQNSIHKEDLIIEKKNTDQLNDKQIAEIVGRLKASLQSDFFGFGTFEDNINPFMVSVLGSIFVANFGDNLTRLLKQSNPSLIAESSESAVQLPENKKYITDLRHDLQNEVDLQLKALAKLKNLKNNKISLNTLLLVQQEDKLHQLKRDIQRQDILPMNIPSDLIESRLTLLSIAVRQSEDVSQLPSMADKKIDWSKLLTDNGTLAKLKDYSAKLKQISNHDIDETCSNSIENMASFIATNPTKTQQEKAIKDFSQDLSQALKTACELYSKAACERLQRMKNITLVAGRNDEEFERSLKELTDEKVATAREVLEQPKGFVHELALNTLSNFHSDENPDEHENLAQKFLKKQADLTSQHDSKEDSPDASNGIAAYQNPYVLASSEALSMREFNQHALHELGHCVDEQIGLEAAGSPDRIHHTAIKDCLKRNCNSKNISKRKEQELYADWFACKAGSNYLHNNICELVESMQSAHPETNMTEILTKEEDEYPSLIKRAILSDYYKHDGKLPDSCQRYVKEQKWKLENCT